MVFQKKNTPKAKQQTPAKSKKKSLPQANDFDDMGMEFDDDSDESDGKTMKKTSLSKTPKGKQSLNDKKVAFQIPGKNSPAEKTPKNVSLVGRKQATPAKGALKEFQGILANSGKKNGTKRAAPEDDDDDDDDEDDDDDDDEDDDDDDAADLDMMFGGGGDDDDDDDDDEEDDDDDDDDEDDDDDDDDEEEAEEEQPKIKKQNAKQQNQSKNSIKKEPSEGQNKSPSKVLEKTPKATDKNKKSNISIKKESESPKAVSPKKTEKKAVNPAIKNFLEMDAERRKERDRRTLFVGNLPKDVTPTEIKALSADILNVNIPHSQKKRRNVFAFLEFASEAKAEENFKLLKSKKLRGEQMTVDYAGEKSNKAKVSESEKPYNLKKLFVPNLPSETTIDQVAKFFPKAVQIVLNSNPSYRTATVMFHTDEEAADALNATKSAELGGKPLTAFYSIQRDGKMKKRKRSKTQKQQPSAKKMKLQAEEDSDDDDDDDDE